MNHSYALDVNVERAEDVLMHKRLLYSARDPANRPVIEVRLVQVSVYPTHNHATILYFLWDSEYLYLANELIIMEIFFPAKKSLLELASVVW